MKTLVNVLETLGAIASWIATGFLMLFALIGIERLVDWLRRRG